MKIKNSQSSTPPPAKGSEKEVKLGEGKKISATVRQYPKKIGKHGIDDEKNLNPEE